MREMKIRGVLAALAIAACAAVNALTLSNAPGMIISDDLPVEPGVWNTNFAEAKKLADANGIPMIVFWADPSCGQCKKLEAACATSAIINWQEKKKYVFVFGYGTGGEGATIKAFAKPPSSTRWPYCCVYWKGRKLIQFTGRSGDATIPADLRKGTLAQQFMNVCDYYAGDYEVDVFPGGTIESVDPVVIYFPNQSTETSRNAELTLVREKTGATNQMYTVTYPSGLVETNTVKWTATETSKTVNVAIKRSEYAPGEDVFFQVFNAKGEVLDVGMLSFVEAPYLGGSFQTEPGVLEAEPTIDSLDLELTRDVKDSFSQTLTVSYKKSLVPNGNDTVSKVVNVVWKANETNKVVTVDFADADKTAGNKVEITLKDGDETVGETDITFVAPVETSIVNPKWIGDEFGYGEWTMDLDAALAKGGRVLAVTEGTLWCGDCANMKRLLFDTDTFKNWAVENEVTLVTIDSPSTDGKTLLSYSCEGGAKYLSRKGISPEDAEEIYNRNYEYVYGTWKLPSQVRTGFPVFFALKADGSIAGRIIDCKSPAYSSTVKAAAMVQRLNELLALVDDDAEEDTEFGLGGNSLDLEESVKGSISGADLVDMYELYVYDDAIAKIALSASTEVTEANEVTLSLCRVEEGEEEDTLVEVASVTGSIASGLSFDASVSADEEYYVTVSATRPQSGDVTGRFALYNPNPSEVSYAISTSVLVTPEEVAKSYTTASGFLTIRATEGEIYRMQGLGDMTGVSGFESIDDKKLYYRATVTDDITVPTLYGVGEDTTVSYQLWRPGEFSFVKPEQMAFSFNGEATVTVQRTGGSSGAASVKINVVEHGGTIEEGRVTIPAQLTLSWASGESGEKSITVALVDNKQLADSEFVIFGLEAVTLPAGAVVDDGSHKLVVSDSTDPVFQEAEYDVGMYQNFVSGLEFGVFNVTNGTVTLTKKTGALPAGLTLKYDSEKKAVVLSGTPTAKGTFTASFTITTTVGGKKTTGAATSFTITVDDPAEKNPYTNKAYNNTSAVVYEQYEDGLIVVGELTVSVTAKNRITAKYQSTESVVTTFTGSWGDIDPETGTAVAMLTNSKGAILNLSLDTNGTLSGYLENVSNYFPGPLTVNETPEKKTGKWKAFTGYYTVTLPYRDICCQEVPEGGIYEPHGTGYITLTMTSTSAVKAGRVNYVGYLPNGQYINGMAYLTFNPDNEKKAKIFIFKRASKDVTGIAVTICADAADTCDDTSQLQVIKDIPGFVNYTLHRESGNRYEYATTLLAYGGYFTKSLSPLKICEMFDYEDLYTTRKFALEFDASNAADGANGSIDEARLPSAIVTAKSSGFSLSDKVGTLSMSYAKATGIISGTARIYFSSGKYLTGSYKCALLPGWDDCGCGDGTEDIVTRPFASGTLFFTDKEPKSGIQIKRSIPVDLTVIPEE